ncbi:MAG TPA: copper resistance CopC family protein [Nakamurella sp.]|jgi:hypothetical protein
MQSRPAARSTLRAVLVLAVTLLATLGLAAPASAHATLIGSDPANGAVVQTAPTVVTLTFDDALANFEPVVTVTGPDGTAYQTGAPTVDGAQLRSAVAALPVAGAYTIAYRVVSGDGHPVEGTVSFELAATAVAPVASPTPAGTGTPDPTSSAASSSATAAATAAPTVTSGTDAASSSSSSGWSVWQWLIVGLFILLAFLATLVVRKRMEASARARSGDGQ